MASVARLSLAVHASIPPAIFSVLANAMITNKTYSACRLMGELVPPRLRTALRRGFVVFNCALPSALFAFLHWNCPTYSPDEEAQQGCLPSYTLVAIVLLVLLWLDRGALAFLHAPNAATSTFTGRVARGATCVGFLMATSEQDEIAQLFLVVALMNRYSGSVRLAKRLQQLDRALRTVVAVLAVRQIPSASSSRRLAVLCIMCCLHGR